jgi:hypothetical protein
MERAEVRMAGAARSAAAAAIGKGERTQAGTVVLMRDRRAVNFMCDGRAVNFMRERRTVNYMCDRRAVNGAIGGHGSLQK